MTALRDDWDALSAEWRAFSSDASTGVDALRTKVQRRQRELAVLLAGELCFTIAVVTTVMRRLYDGLTKASLAMAVAVLAMTVVVWTFTIWNRRRTWSTLAETTVEYLRLSRRRIAAGTRTLRFVRASAGVYFVAYGPWFAVRAARHGIGQDEGVLWAAAAIYGAGLVIWSVWYARRLRSDLAQVEAIEDSLGLHDSRSCESGSRGAVAR
ncbi:MAG: hypothetical protein Q8K82_16240 [Gemmatimonadaceae bacterium]|nr:hypothetical protein [Gemmatimonadaceae bacterium]